MLRTCLGAGVDGSSSSCPRVPRTKPVSEGTGQGVGGREQAILQVPQNLTVITKIH